MLEKNVPVKYLTTFRAGGKAKFYTRTGDYDQIKRTLTYAKMTGIDICILGVGSNILFSDEGYDGLILKIACYTSQVDVLEKNTDEKGKYKIIRATSAMPLPILAKNFRLEGLTGAEFCSGIPGSVGGAVVMNAGAFGQQMSDIVKEVTYLDGDDLVIRTIRADELKFGYRKSFFSNLNRHVILDVTFKAYSADYGIIGDKMKEFERRREETQPIDIPSAGSTFKRPEGHYAAKLIEDCNLKGFKLNDSGAQVSPMHAGFIVNNDGKASATDIFQLIKYVRKKVYEEKGILLEPEVKLIGFSESLD